MSDNLQPYGTQDTAPPSEPLTREEQYLSAIAGITSSSDIPEKPLTRVEKYLKKIVENGGGGGGGGTSDYSALSNKPQINNTTLSGNKTSSDLGLQDKLTEAQQAAADSGITAEKLSNVENDILNIKGKTDKIVTDSSSKTYYLTPTTPQSPVDGDIWIY